MPSTTSYKQGDVVLVSFPFTDLTSSKRRPALVVSPDSFNAAGEDVILAAITSQITGDQHAILLSRDDFADGQLPKKSVVKPTELFTMHSSLIIKKVCGLKRGKTEEVLRSVQRFFS
ncbi:MAG TPA: type II toxin-antitoxin system PemK/MazF family toxin [Terriglobia bacterium]|nr:type II toxin-antitoxin system PemK/MazF family toxin [Terriglobia bacterium]